jgi:hypothetical protein
MLINQTTYPEFVADQILSSDHLNRLFGYLDEEQRLTRANLLGIGIVCGLDVKLNGAGDQLTIAKGSGITSKGYLVSIPDSVYTGYKLYDISREHTYATFTNIFALDPNSSFKAYELVQDTTAAGVTPLTATFLQDYTVMMYVELLQQTRQNCDTNDCDYDGIMVKVSLKPLLIPNSFVPLFISGAADTSSNIAALPEIALNRFDVTATSLKGSASIIEGYRSILSGQVQKLGDALNAVFVSLYPFVSDEYAINPFPGLIDDLFYFLNDGSYPVNSMLHIQYYYDLLADIYNVYDGIRENGDHLIGMCNPDQTLFPQHLMLGPAINRTVDGSRVANRHYFMPSGAVKSCSGGIGDLRLEFKRLVLLLQRFVLPEILSEQVGSDTPRGNVPVRITPDVIGDMSLADKSIPFYYDAAGGDDKLYRYWNYSRTHAGQADRNLSYNADTYRTGGADDPILKPLYYDLEEYNFFRVEGHIGMSYRTAVNTILTIRNQHRLPFEVMAIRTSQPTESLFKKLCCGDGLELSYDIVRREWEAVVGETIEFINANASTANSLLGTGAVSGFIGKLQNVKNYLVDDVSAFMPKYDAFMSAFESIETDCETYRNTIYEQMGDTGTNGFVPGEDLIDHLDALRHSNRKGAFRAVYQAWKGLGASIEETLTLSEYLKAHPGITHKAGVPVGGTLVLVYHTADTKEDEQHDVDIMLGRVPEGTVIADFYLPYLCCSDCSPVQVVIGDGKPPEVRPTISVQDNITSICRDDAAIRQQYKVTILPDTSDVSATVDGAAAPAGVLSNNGSGWVFTPSAVNVPSAQASSTVMITATNGSLSATYQITVYAMPVLQFQVSSGSTANEKKFQLINSQHVAGNVTWTFGDGASTTAAGGVSVLHSYALDSTTKTYHANVSAANGSCTAFAQAQDVVIAGSEPCNGVKKTCNYVWPYTRETGYKNVSLEITVTKCIVNGVNGGGTQFSVVQSMPTFATLWNAISGKLNSLYNNVKLVFGSTPGAYQQTGYLVPLTTYFCPEFQFTFEFTVRAVYDGSQQEPQYYRFSSVNGTERLASPGGSGTQIYQDPECRK